MSRDVHVYFDMDGVLANFDRGVRELCHREPLVQGKCTEEETNALWEDVKVVPHFYAQLEPIEGSLEMLREVYDVLGDRCQILTGVPKPWRGIEHASEDKVEWMHRLFSPEITVHTVLRKEKRQFCTGPQDVLVDDFIANIKEWERAGGTGILFHDAQETIERLRRILREQ